MLAPAAPALPSHAALGNSADAKPTDRTAFSSQGQSAKWLTRTEIGLGVVLTLASVYLHLLQSQVAGGLWRDEAVSVQVANMPTLSQTWRYLEFDSYPVLYHLILRGWCALFSAGDASMRTLGVLIGLSLLGTLWSAGRALGIRVPLLALGLLAFNPIVIRYGDSVRAYGLGCSVAILSLTTVWTVARAERIAWRRVVWAMVAAVLSTQCLYHNAALLLAGCLGGALVALWNRRAAVAAATLAIGVPAAILLLPYLPIIHRTRRWSFLMAYPITPQWLWTRLAMVIGSPVAVGVWLWTGLFVGSVGLTGWWFRAAWRRGGELPSGVNVRVFAGFALAAAMVIYGAFLYSVGYITQPWYYLAFLAFAAICLDAVYGQSAAATGWRWCRVALVGIFGLCSVGPGFAALQVRNTNVDFIAADLNASAQPRDLVVVNRWECAISLNRYYHGPARLMTIPPIEDHAVHRYDLMMNQLMAPDPLRPLFDAMHASLQAGGRVWLVGSCFLPERGESVKPLPPASIDSKGRWSCGMRLEHWALEVNNDLFRHCTQGERVPVECGLKISEFEDVPLCWFSGWKGDAAVPRTAAP